MKRLVLPKFFFIITFLAIASTVRAQYDSHIDNIDSCLNTLNVTKCNSGDSIITVRRLAYPIYYFKQADIDGDGRDDFVIGAIKIANFDKIHRKRINIWTLRDGRIVPLWLGSKMPHPLYDFRVTPQDGINHIVTIENEADGLYLLAEYKWQSFGLKFMQYIKREIPLNEAVELLSN